MRSIKYFTVLAFAFVVTGIAQSPPAIPESSQLFETVAQLDAKMFGAFNAHDVDLSHVDLSHVDVHRRH
jgi:hypothetical protein